MKRTAIFLGMALMLATACAEKDIYPVAYINAVEGSTFTPEEVSAYGATITVSFNTNYAWQVRGWSTLGFCSLDATSGEMGDGTITITVPPNTTSAVRTDSFNILAGAAVQTVTISQTETNAMSVGTTEYSVPSEGGTVEIVVSANTPYTVNIPSEISWITDISTKVMTTSYVTLQVAANTEWGARSTSGITISGEDVSGNPITSSITVNQESPIKQSWTKSFASDLTAIASGTPCRLAMRNGDLYVSNGTGIHALNPSTGDYKGSVTIDGLTVAPQSMASDNAGNLLFAANATGSDMVTVYKYDGTSVTVFGEYNGANMPNWGKGNLRVVGDITKNAVVTMVASLWGNSSYYIAWQVTDGAVASPVTGSIGPLSSNPSNIAYACVSPVSDKLTDGLIFTGYEGAYVLHYCADPISAKTWETVHDFSGAWNTNYSCISVVEYGGKRYCAVGKSWFGGNVPTVHILDITSLPTVVSVYDGEFSGIWESDPVGNDVLLTVEDGALKLYHVNILSDMITCVELPKQ